MEILLLGLNHKSAPIYIREKFSFAGPKLDEALGSLRNYPGIDEAVVISTCNRTEIYAAGNSGAGILESLWDFVLRSMGPDSGPVRKYFYALDNRPAVEHLFQVAASLDSMIIGETQIFGQVKDAYFKARGSGAIGRCLDNIFEEAIRTGKKVRTLTQIGKGAISTSTAAIELARKIFETLEDKKVLIIGAGKIGELTVKNLSSRGIRTVIVANRTMAKAEELAKRFSGRAVNFSDIFECMRGCDIIISSTSAPHFLIGRDEVREVMKARNNLPLFFIDLGMPRNIDPAVNLIDNAYLYNIDDLAQVCDANIKERRSEARKAQLIVEDCADAALKRMACRPAAGEGVLK